MKKRDLKHGNVVETRNGNKWLFCWDWKEDKLIDLKGRGYETIDCHYEDLTYFNGFIQLDIMKVYKDYTCKELLWERKEQSILTEAERIILENIDEYYKWICRDKDNSLVISRFRPSKVEHYNRWYATPDRDSDVTRLPFNKLFRFIQWEDDEPYCIKDLLEERGNN